LEITRTTFGIVGATLTRGVFSWKLLDSIVIVGHAWVIAEK
jgi:hypothetical protein